MLSLILIMNVSDYLRETEDILSYEPFLGVADPPGPGAADHSVTGGRGQPGPAPSNYHAPSAPSDLGGAGGTDPMFAGPINNVTVNVGREAVLECHVNNLRGYKVRDQDHYITKCHTSHPMSQSQSCHCSRSHVKVQSEI